MPDFNLLTLMADIEERRAELRRDIRRIERLWFLMALAWVLCIVTVVMAVML